MELEDGEGSGVETRLVIRMRRFGPPALIVVLLAAAFALGIPLLDSGNATVADPRIPLLVLVGCWAAFELVLLYLQFGKNLDNAVTISATEIPLALGLLFATPVDLVLAAVATPVLIDLIRRRKPALKQVFNGSSRALDVCIALSIYRALDPADPLSAQGWAALCLAVTASALASTFGVAAVISLTIGRLPLRDLSNQVLWAGMLAPWGATLSFVAGLALQAGHSAVVPLLVSLVAFLLMMRGISLLTERQMNLASLQSLGQRLASAHNVDSILATALDTSTEMLVAREVEVYLHSPKDLSTLLQVRQGSNGELVQTPVGGEDIPDKRGVLEDRSTVVAAAPQTLGHEVVMSATGRSVAMRPFGSKDARLLDMIAHQTGATLNTAHLFERLRHDALHDTLTDLPNRRSLLETVRTHVSRGHPVELVWLGIRDLQGVNAALGHDRGDEMLVQIGRRLQAASGPDAVVGRVGGDEFAILLATIPDGSSASEAASAALTSLSEPFMLARVQVLVRASAGFAVEPGGFGGTAEDLLRRADIAMRFAQRTGRTVERYTPELETATSERLELAVDLQTGITRGELTLYAQPQIRLGDDAITGVEMLVRWNHPRLGLLQPVAFVPLAEQTGLDWPMTAWVLDEALKSLAEWGAAGLELSVSVNVSPNALCDGRLRDLTEELLARHGVPGRRLVIEVTESGLLMNTTMAAEVLNGLSALGVRVSIDDFGTGFSSLSHLRRLPVDQIKIDYSFVTTMLRDNDDAAIVRSVVGLSKGLGLTCVAEGIEDEYVYAALQELGCDSAQGYYMARPMPVEQIVTWMQSTQNHSWTASASSGGPRG